MNLGKTLLVLPLLFGIPNSPLFAFGAAPSPETQVFSQPYQIPANKLPIFYRPEYNISLFGIEKFHPFDSKKFGRIFKELIMLGTLHSDEVVAPPFPSEELLLKVHSRAYLDSLKVPSVLRDILEISILSLLPASVTERQVLHPMRYATGGTVLAAQAAMERGWAINLGGGFHHASADAGGGFCAYADIALAIRNLRQVLGRPARAMIVDLDAHQGNGHETDFLADKQTFIVDAYNADIYPEDEDAKKAIDLAVELKSGTSDVEYLEKISAALELASKRFSPEIVIYNAGTDIMAGDELGKLNISAQGIIQRDEIVFRWAKSYGYPIVMLLSGGYQKANAPVIAQSIDRLLRATWFSP